MTPALGSIFPIWQSLQFIGRNGQIPGSVPLPSLIVLTLGLIKVAAIALAISIAIGVPLGAWLGHIHRGSFVAINIGNLWRALPSIAVLAIGGTFLGLGLEDVLLALVVLAVPPILTNAYAAVDGVDRGVVDAARGMGMTEWRILTRIELPLAVPLVMTGVRTGALFTVSTAVVASLAGFSGTLGDVIANETSYKLSGVLGAAIVIAVLALVVDGLLGALERWLTPKPLRGGEAPVDAVVLPPALQEVA